MVTQLREENTTIESVQEGYTLSTREAVEYLRKKHPGVRITTDMISHRVIRGDGIPHKSVQHGNSTRWFFRPCDLDKIIFRSNAKRRSLAERIAIVTEGESAYDEPIVVRDTSDLEMLHRKYGSCVDDDALIEAIYQLTGHRYTRGAIKQRRSRGTILFVGYTDTPRKKYWYPVAQLIYIHFQPEAAQGQKVRRGHDESILQSKSGLYSSSNS